MSPTNKFKIINDPVYGFISIPRERIFDIIEHPWFQRLRRIRQLGLTSYTYPSAQHTRFQHALGAMHLMNLAITSLRHKGIEINESEAEGLGFAILLHDIGHGPFSHTLEQTLVSNLPHETLSGLIIEELNHQTGGALEIAHQIFTGSYPKKFLHQLVSSQLDMDRLDYLARDSFFTGVAEGVIGYDRIIKMLTVCNDELVVEEKGIYSIEKFLISRRLMYWQVYLHKTVIAADQMLVTILQRAKHLTRSGHDLFATPALRAFLTISPGYSDFAGDKRWFEYFARLDDHDILASIKAWRDHPDRILAWLCDSLICRRLFRVELQAEPFAPELVEIIRHKTMEKYDLNEEELGYFFLSDTVENRSYNPRHERILIRSRSGALTDISAASEQLNNAIIPTLTRKYLLYYPKDINI